MPIEDSHFHCFDDDINIQSIFSDFQTLEIKGEDDEKEEAGMPYVFEDEPVQLKTINATKFYEKNPLKH
ncbi:hypothetical protein [Cytobacillus horneckiae]|uniref:hypothetical protein n=1 Tax=Cytobacillus horneckiae TaxID=549687 RepID=UPI003D9AA035